MDDMEEKFTRATTAMPQYRPSKSVSLSMNILSDIFIQIFLII